jgi:hypothetical protein
MVTTGEDNMNRREVLGGMALAAAVRPALALSARDASKAMTIYSRLRGGVNGGLALWWYTGTVWGKPADDIARPMFGVQGLTFNRAVLRPDGGIDQALAGRGWYSDAQTGKRLDTWTNPFTGEKVTPPHIKSLSRQSVDAKGVMAVGENDRLEQFKGDVGGLTMNGDTLWMTENFVGKGKPDAARGGAVNTSSSLSTFTAKIADVENEKADFVPTYLNYQSLGSWPAWMKMGERVGTLSWQTRGLKVRGPEAGPADLRAWIEAGSPGFLYSPGI